MDFLKKGTFWSLLIWVVLLIIITIFYVKKIVIMPIIPDIYNYFTLIFSIMWISFWFFKFFYVIEIKDMHSEVNRIKSHYFNILRKENYSEIINLSDRELIRRYNSETDLKWAEEAIGGVQLAPRNTNQ